jgi:hypothetical protein
MEAEEAPLAVDAAALGAALGVPVQLDSREGEPPTYRFSQRVAFAEGLSRHGYLDLAGRRFRSTLWAGAHRCLDHLELADLADVACDAAAGRLVLSSEAMRLVLTRHGTLSVVPLAEGFARARRRERPASGE